MRLLFYILLLGSALLGCVACAQTGRYQMAVIPATPIHEDRLVILDTVTGEGKVFMNNSVRSFSYEREVFSKLRLLSEDSKSE